MSKSHDAPKADEPKVLTCGLIMPISAIDGCTAEHWSDVKLIILEAIESVKSLKFTASLVSDADDSGVIQRRIVQGIYNSDIVVCDVSGKNSNVMFELGMRLAFDKPTVIIKDDKTGYSFDTSIIEHLSYPRDLRFSRIVDFKASLAEKIAATYEASLDPRHSTFLKNFGTFTVASLEKKVGSSEQVMLESIQEIQQQLTSMRLGMSGSNPLPVHQQIKASNIALQSSRLRKLLAELETVDAKWSSQPAEVLADLIMSNYPTIANSYKGRDHLIDELRFAQKLSN